MPPDFGPIYTETNLGRFPVEPWNTASNLIFLFIIIYFARKTKFDHKTHPLFVIALPILFVGFVGGTVFHATRSARMWLVMDYMPIMILALLASIFFFEKLVKNRIVSFAIACGTFVCLRLLFSKGGIPTGFKIATGYTLLASLILVPAILVCRKEKWENARYLVKAAVLFSAAIIFRSLDSKQLLPMGTHFLWHIFGGLSVFNLLEYVWFLEKKHS